VRVKAEKEGEACCPLCLKPFPQDGVAAIQANITTNCLIKIFNKKEGKVESLVEIVCSKCGRVDAPVTTWCLECRMPLCVDCSDVHSKQQEDRVHETVTVKEFVQLPKRISQVIKKEETCKKHTKEALDTYCKTCNVKICRECALKGHIQHTFILIKIMEEEKEKENASANLVINTILNMKNILKRENDKKERPGELYVGKYDYTADDDDDLSFKMGDLLYIINNEGDWWLAEAKDSGKQGYIPKNYVAIQGSLEAQE